jgi:3-oxoacyl-[acyl-carrier-protein] synthase II
MKAKNISIYGCGVVSPFATKGAEDPFASFLRDIRLGHAALTPSEAFGSSFLVGQATFEFSRYRDPIVRLANEKRYVQLQKSAGECVQFAVGATLDALSCCPGLEHALSLSRDRVATVIGTGLADLGSAFKAREELDRADFAWQAFWGRERALQALANEDPLPEGLINPQSCDDEYEAWQARRRLYRYFAQSSSKLHEFLQAYEDIERRPLDGGDAGLINQLKAKASERLALRRRFGAPVPPWDAVSPNVLWNIPNLAAAQVSMMLQTHGLTIGVSAACSTFALALRVGLDEIRSNRADVAIVGATDGNPKPEILAAFQAARVGAFGHDIVQPLTALRGTHLAGGACIWVLCSDDWAATHGLGSLGARVLSSSVTSDGEHVITPSADGPSRAIDVALNEAGVSASDIDYWDLHSTGTPGDVQELDHVKKYASNSAIMTARKGQFGHGMGACGGWELTAQIFGPQPAPTDVGLDSRQILPSETVFEVPASGIDPSCLAAAVKQRGLNILTDHPGFVVAKVEPGSSKAVFRCAKLSMGVGGVSSCVVAERWAE